MPNNQTNQKLFISCKQFVKCRESIPFLLQPKRTCWIVATINPIPCRPCVHPSTFPKVLIDNFYSSKHREIIIIAHNYFKKQNTNQ